MGSIFLLRLTVANMGMLLSPGLVLLLSLIEVSPTFFKYFEEQNERRARGELKSDIVELHLSSLGILNGCIDTLIEMPMYPEYALNNPYGIESYNSTVAKAALNRYYDKGGCRDMLLDCRETQKKLDPENFGLNEEVNTKCRTASLFCFENLRNPFIVADRYVYIFINAFLLINLE